MDLNIKMKHIIFFSTAEKAAPTPTKAPSPAKPSPLPPPLAPRETIPIGKDHTEVIKGIRKAMVKTMTAAAHIPTFGYNDEVDMTRLVELRADIKKVTEQNEVRFSYMPIVVKVNSVLHLSYMTFKVTVNIDISYMPIVVKVNTVLSLSYIAIKFMVKIDMPIISKVNSIVLLL